MAHFPHKSEGQRSEGRRNTLPLLIKGREGSVIMQVFFKVRVDGITSYPMSPNLNGNKPHFISQSKASNHGKIILYQSKIFLASTHRKMRFTRRECVEFLQNPLTFEKNPLG